MLINIYLNKYELYNKMYNLQIIFQWQSFNARYLHTSSALAHDALFVHRDTPEDNPDIPFNFTEENEKVTQMFKIIFLIL